MADELIQLEPDHESKALRDFYWQFRRDPNLRAFMESIAYASQVFEELVFDLIVSTGLAVATGEELSFWGELVGEPPGSLDTAEYRAIISGRILARHSNGSIPEIVAVLKAAADAERVQAWDAYPAGMTLVAWREDPMRDVHRSRVARVMADPKLGGVRLLLVESLLGAALEYDTDPGYDEGEYSELIWDAY